MFVGVHQSFADLVAPSAGASADNARENRRTILILGQGAQAIYLSKMAERAGLHCLGTYAPQSVLHELGWSCPADYILLDLRDSAMLAEAGALANWVGGSSLSILVDIEGLDHAFSVFDGLAVDYLCDPADSEIVTMLVMAGLCPRESGNQLHDGTRDDEVARLEQLSQDVQRLAVTVERMSAGFGRGLRGGASSADRSEVSYVVARTKNEPSLRSLRPLDQHLTHLDAAAVAAPTLAEIRALIRARRTRERFFSADMFADPAWDMMLDLLAARLAGQRVSVSSLCIAAAVPPTTALRWIKQLSDRAMFMRVDDPMDGRRVFIDLTEAATQALFGWVLAVRRNGGLLAAI